MPGFILHMTAAKLLFEKYSFEIDKKAFEVGNLIPDSVQDKTWSHFRNPSRDKMLMVYPDLELFRNKYAALLTDASCLGYYFHLFIDCIYARDYLASLLKFLDIDGNEAEEREQITHIEIQRTGELVPVRIFFSDEYFYGDYTKLNTWLMNRFDLSWDFDIYVKNPGITEVDYHHITIIREQLDSYLNVPEDAVDNLKVFETDSLIGFLQDAADQFYKLIT